MRYTYASNTDTHAGTGKKLQQDTKPVKSSIPANDFNMIIWSLMAVVEGGGLAATNFNPDNASTYQVLRNAICRVVHPVGSVIIRNDTVDPATLYPGTTWTQISTGRTLVGLDTGDTDFDTPGKTGGAKTVTLTVNQIPPHTHKVTYRDPDDTAPVNPGGTGTGSPTVDIDTGSTGGGQPHNNMPPFRVVVIWCRTA